MLLAGCGPESIKDANTSEACQSEAYSILCKTTVQSELIASILHPRPKCCEV